MPLPNSLPDHRPDRPTSGAAMDTPAPRPRRRRALKAGAVLAAALLAAAGLWLLLPRGMAVPLAQVRTAVVERGMFRDELLVRATVVPLRSVLLDAVESGRVEEVFAHDGAQVRQGDPLFRLSNPQRRLELLAREAEHAQQIANLANLRVAMQAGRAERQRRIADLDYALAQAGKQHARNQAMAARGYLSTAALEDSVDRVRQQRRLLDAELAGDAAETATGRAVLRQMEAAIVRLEAGMKLVNATIAALVVRAPVNGRLTDFRLQVGETVRLDQHIGRVDDLERFLLVAQVDEYYLARVGVGRPGGASVAGQPLALSVSRVYPQVRDGKFTIELAIGGRPPPLRPGQSLDVAIALGGAGAALLLPNDAFVNDTAGSWVFVVAGDGRTAARRPIRLGRRGNGQLEVLAGLRAGERVIVSSYAGYGQARRLLLAGQLFDFSSDMTQ